METTILNDITDINNITVNGTHAIITIPKADLLAYIQSLNTISNANITKYTTSKASLTSQSATYDTQISAESSNISDNASLITLLS